MGNSRSNTSRKPSHEEKQAIRNDYENFVKTLPEVRVGDDISHRKEVVTNNGDVIRVDRTFFSETFTKTQNNPKLSNTISIAKEFENWIPTLNSYTVEDGRHHQCQFAVFSFVYRDYSIEMKAMIKDSFMKAYIMKIQ